MAAALLAALALQATPETLADLERAFDQTCNSRVYGQFDDMCSAMETQVKAYRAELRRRPHDTKPAPPLTVASPPPVSEPPSPGPPAAAPPKG